MLRMRDEARAGARAKSQGLCSMEFPRKANYSAVGGCKVRYVTSAVQGK